jgi:hypothetical protein
MKITKSQLRQIIKEELTKLTEGEVIDFPGPPEEGGDDNEFLGAVEVLKRTTGITIETEVLANALRDAGVDHGGAIDDYMMTTVVPEIRRGRFSGKGRSMKYVPPSELAGEILLQKLGLQ